MSKFKNLVRAAALFAAPGTKMAVGAYESGLVWARSGNVIFEGWADLTAVERPPREAQAWAGLRSDAAKYFDPIEFRVFLSGGSVSPDRYDVNEPDRDAEYSQKVNEFIRKEGESRPDGVSVDPWMLSALSRAVRVARGGGKISVSPCGDAGVWFEYRGNGISFNVLVGDGADF